MSLNGAMQAIWEQSRAEVLNQVAVIEDAVSNALAGTLDDQLREGAAREAHKISGSVGTLGFVRAAEYARALESALRAPHPRGVAPEPLTRELRGLSDLVCALRGELESSLRPEPDSIVTPAPDGLGVGQEDGGLLVVDRNAERGRRILAEAHERGLAARLASSMASARDLLGRASPDVVLLDLSVSETSEDSLSFLGEIARDRPVLVVSDPTRSIDRVEVARRGGRGFLPNSLSTAQTVDAVTALRERLRTRGTRILALDDDPMVLALLTEVLGQADMAVSTCDDGSRFLEQLERISPDLVILDFDMPGITGPELCRVVRNDQRWEGLPVVLLTSRRDPESVRAVFDAGADDYVSKPFVGPELVARISNRLERVRLYRALAETDPLTGLANRRRSVDAIEGYMRMAARMVQPLCLSVLDVDRFKSINDSHGHAAGDAVLRGLGSELLRSFRGEDVVARWGGDEFVVGMFGMSSADGRRRMDDFVEALRDRNFEGLSITISAGVAEHPSDGDDVGSLYRAADHALYEVKGKGRDGVAVARHGSFAELASPPT